MLSGSLRCNSRILVVENSEIVARGIESSLHELGYTLTDIAHSAEAALAAASMNCPDLVLMDIRIQGQMDGIETAMLLRKQFHVPIVYLTSPGDDESIERARKTEPLGYLLKPFEKSELRSVIDIALFRYDVEKKRKVRETFFETAMKSGTNAVMTISAAGKILSINRIAEELLGWTEAEVLQKQASEIFKIYEAPAGKALSLLCSFSGVDTEIRNFRGYLAHRIDGKFSAISYSFVPVSDAKTHLGSVVIFNEDTNQASEHVNVLGTMAAGLAHDISTPLASLILTLEIALSELKEKVAVSNLEKEQRIPSPEKSDNIIKLLEKAERSATHLQKIVMDFKRLSRKEETQPGAVDLRNIVEWAMDVSNYELCSKAKIIRVFGDVPKVYGSETKLGQVMINLLMNAAQSIESKIKLENEIRVVTLTDKNGRAVVEISDSGCGMTPETIAKIFTPFFTTKPTGIGTGLGLPICNGIIRALGGFIEVESVVGKGSIFRVVLPKAEISLMDKAPLTKENQGKAMKILVIDDEPLIAKGIQQILGENYAVKGVASGKEAAVNLGNGDDFDIILCDIKMPEMTGFQFYEHMVRQHPEMVSRLVFMSGTLDDLETDFLKAIPNRRLEKPFTVKDLRLLLSEMFS